MSDIVLKTLIASLFVAAAAGAFLTMMAVFGRPEKAAAAPKLRKLHRVLGWTAVVLLVPLVYLGLSFVKEMGDGMSTRAVFHMVLAETLVALVLLKVLIVKFFRGLLKNATALGMAVFGLALVVYLITAGFMIVHGFGG
jgi:Family of unknown function (DUF6529)